MWEAVVGDSELGLLSSTAAAALAADAWTLAHQWNLASRVRRYTSVADTRVFVSWADEYQRRVGAAGATDLARLPDIVRDYVDSNAIAAPQRVVLAGFDETTVQQQRLFDALVARGALCDRFEPAQHDAKPLRATCRDARDETINADWVAASRRRSCRSHRNVVPQLIHAPRIGAALVRRSCLMSWRRQASGRTRLARRRAVRFLSSHSFARDSIDARQRRVRGSERDAALAVLQWRNP